MAKSTAVITKRFSDERDDYEMSKHSRFIRRRSGLAPQGGSADYHYRNEPRYYEDIEKARDMDRNDCIMGQTVERAVSNIVQQGFRLDPKTGDSGLDTELWTRWKEWSEDADQCDVAGEFTWHDFEIQSTRSMLVDGDCFVLGLEEGSLQFIEGHSVQTRNHQENTFCGVTRDDYRRHVKYWIQQDGITPTDNKETASDIDVRDEDGFRTAFQVYVPKRAHQTRGVTAFAPIFAVSGMFEDINFAKLVQQQIVSCIAFWRKRAPGSNPPPTTGSYGEQSTETTTTGEARIIEGLAPGAEIITAAGEELAGFSPNIPNPEYFEQARMILQIMGMNLGIPLCMLMMDGSETNFSGWRGAVDEARKGFKRIQLNQLNRLHRPSYRFKVRDWMQNDTAIRKMAARSNIKIFGHEWTPPESKYIDPVGDAQGDALRLQNNLTSPRRLHNEGGRDWETIADETIADNAYAIVRAKAKAAEINEKFNDGAPVHWRELVSLPMPNGLNMTMEDPNKFDAAKLQSRGFNE